ncbi:MAG: class I SAM-dependent methyltransferase [Pseudomonadota bacterium]
MGDEIQVRVAEAWDDYRLLDSGEGQKLEAFGPVRLVRPEAQAMWPRTDEALWEGADARFEGVEEEEGPGRWSAPLPDFSVRLGSARMVCRLTANRHIGLFPEQRPHWDTTGTALKGLEAPEVLNVFGYTGAASLFLAAQGARVTHVDASKKAIAWGRENQAASRMEAAPIRWICDDARKFLAREVRRGRRYQAILLDPPKFGRGPKNEVWNLFDDLAPLLRDAAALLADDARILIVTAYAIRASALSVGRALEAATERRGKVVSGELAVREDSGRLLPTSMYAQWRP